MSRGGVSRLRRNSVHKSMYLCTFSQVSAGWMPDQMASPADRKDGTRWATMVMRCVLIVVRKWVTPVWARLSRRVGMVGLGR